MWPKVLVVLLSSGSISWKRARLSGEKGSPEYVQVLRELRLRYFTPMEVAKLMGFGPSFAFPTEYLRERKLHCYRVLGNSLNVRVVAFLAGILFNHPWWTVFNRSLFYVMLLSFQVPLCPFKMRVFHQNQKDTTVNHLHALWNTRGHGKLRLSW